MKQKIQTLLDQLNHGLVERDATIKTALLTVLAGENLVLIGPPGTGKSLIARRIAESFAHSSDNGYFEYLLTKFSTPEEIFGPLSITELKADRFKRNTAGYLPTVKIAFLDEIFKASSSILNALLTILNERIYHNGAERQAVPMQALIAASNELPNDQEELSALYDRFLVRGFVDYVSQDNLARLFEKTGTMPALTQLTADDLKSIRNAAESVTIAPEIVQVMQRIWVQHKELFKEDRRESLSDRRLKKVIELVKVSAATNGRSEVDLSDVLLLKDCIWNHQTNAIKVRDLILTTLRATFSRHQLFKDSVSAAIASALSNKFGVVVKGLKGSGTEQDPLLIQTVDDLIDLSRPDVGLKNYYFRQTADIDCSALSSWTNIPFKGHYDGYGHTITGRMWNALFSIIQAPSSITNLQLKGLYLADIAVGSRISHCLSTDNLIKEQATNCTITSCQVGNGLIGDTAINCIITDCFSVVNLKGSESESRSGIAHALTQGSVVERCFVIGNCEYQGHGYFYFSGIAAVCDASTVRQCALGPINRITSDVRFSRFVQILQYTSKLQNNASIDSNTGEDDINGIHGKTIATSLFKQRYFENVLEWDFQSVWQWDDTNDRPALRSFGVGAATQRAKPVIQQANTTDLLTQQMRANIWL